MNIKLVFSISLFNIKYGIKCTLFLAIKYVIKFCDNNQNCIINGLYNSARKTTEYDIKVSNINKKFNFIFHKFGCKQKIKSEKF